MTIEEKLNHFMEISIQNASHDSNHELNKYKRKLDKKLERHKENALENARLRESIEAANVKREAKKELSKEQLEIRRATSAKQEELKEKLFKEVLTLLNEYKTSPEYKKLLEKQIIAALDFAKDEEVQIYIDPDDSKYFDSLKEIAKDCLAISSYSFMGGTRAVIHSKNILIDNSFKSKLAEAKEKFIIS